MHCVDKFFYKHFFTVFFRIKEIIKKQMRLKQDSFITNSYFYKKQTYSKNITKVLYYQGKTLYFTLSSQTFSKLVLFKFSFQFVNKS